MADAANPELASPARTAPSLARNWLRPRFSLAALFGLLTVCSLGAWYWYQVPFVVERARHVQYVDENGRGSAQVSKGREVEYVRRVWGGDQDTIRHGAWTLFDGRGKVHSEGHYRNGAKHGQFVNYYVSGAKQQEENYEYGQLHGPTRRWNEAGNLISEVHYSRDRRDGKFFQAHRDGTPSIEGAYHEDVPNGQWVWRPAFGANDDAQYRTLTGAWSHGVPDGVWTLQDPDGMDVLTMRFADRRLVEAEPGEVDSNLAALLARGEIEPPLMLTLFRGADCSFRDRRLIRVVELLRLKYDSQINLAGAVAGKRAKGSSLPLADAPVTYERNRVPLIVALGEIGRPLGLVGDYRYGVLWITTPEQAEDADPTGVEAIAPPPGSRLASAWESRGMDLHFVDTPLGDVFSFLALLTEVQIDTSPLQSLPTASMPLTLQLRNAPLTDTIGAVLLASGCRASLRGETIVIELQELASLGPAQ
jgi:hypothetical protein